MKPTQRRIDSILNQPHTQLGYLTHKITQIQRINQHLQTILPKELQENCYLANVKPDEIVFAAKNASWLTRLRFQAPKLAQGLRDAFPDIKAQKTRCIITKQTTTVKKPRRRPTPSINIDNAKHFQETAKHTDSPELKAALEKLAKHVK